MKKHKKLLLLLGIVLLFVVAYIILAWCYVLYLEGEWGVDPAEDPRIVGTDCNLRMTKAINDAYGINFTPEELAKNVSWNASRRGMVSTYTKIGTSSISNFSQAEVWDCDQVRKTGAIIDF